MEISEIVALIAGGILLLTVVVKYALGQDRTPAAVAAVAFTGLVLIAYPIFNQVTVTYNNLELAAVKKAVKEAEATAKTVREQVKQAESAAFTVGEQVAAFKTASQQLRADLPDVQKQLAAVASMSTDVASLAKVIKAGAAHETEQSPPRLIGSVFFAEGRAELKEGGVKNIADRLRKNPKAHVMIAAYTDPKGSEASNKKLAGDRAASVRRELIENGISADRILIFARGEVVVNIPVDEPEPVYRRADVWAN